MMLAVLHCANCVVWPPVEARRYEADRPIYLSNTSCSDNVVSVDFKRKTVREAAAETAFAAWRLVAAERLNALRSYQPGWDGPQSASISSEALARGGRLLELAFENIAHPAPPSAVPCADGSLQLEWWLTDTRFELSIAADGSTYAWAENRLTGDQAEAEGTDATNLLFQWARKLTANKFIQPA